MCYRWERIGSQGRYWKYDQKKEETEPDQGKII
jgi:hypothetical protein